MATVSNVNFSLVITDNPYATDEAKNATYYYNTQGDATAEYFLTANIGTVTASNGFANVNLTANLDALGPSESKAFSIKIRRNSHTGPVIATSNTINIIGENKLYIEAIGGNTSVSGGYKIHEFRSSGNLEISSSGAPDFKQIDYLIVAGGGGGGGDFAGGGGAGGMITGSSSSIINQTGNILIIVGAGGTGAAGTGSPAGTQGGNSFIGSSLSAIGGGVGFSYQNRVSNPNRGFGGSGGGGGAAPNPQSPNGAAAGGLGMPGQGNPGGTSGGWGAGGGGAGAAGTPSPGPTGGPGGIGASVSWATPFIGVAGPASGRWFSGGGAGGAYPAAGQPNGTGGAGGGGSGPTAGVSFTGGGGGGSGNTPAGSNGGSGAIAVRYLSRPPVTYNITASKGSVHAGNSVNFALVVNNIVAANAKYYYSISGNIIQSELSNSITGNFYTQNGYANINIFTNQTIPTGETRTLQFDVRRLSTQGKILSSSQIVTVYGDTSAVLPFDAIGGSITTDGQYKIHVFSTSDTFLVREGTKEIEYLMVAGGGAGGPGAGNVGAGGGGAGGVLRGNTNVSIGSYSVTVGGGAALTPQVGNRPLPGGNTILGGGLNLIAVGGGSGGQFDASVPGNGGSGSGRTWNSSPPFPAGAGYPGQGNPGGESNGTPTTAAGGGGGAGVAGGNSPSPTAGGKGGNGIFSSITGANVAYAGGGGGGSGTGGLGGWGGGGAGGSNSPGTDASVNTGGGGGGAGLGSRPGGLGGSGIVVIRYVNP